MYLLILELTLFRQWHFILQWLHFESLDFAFIRKDFRENNFYTGDRFSGRSRGTSNWWRRGMQMKIGPPVLRLSPG